MIIPKNIKIEKACSNDELRPALTGVYYNAEDKTLVACDGHMIVEYPIDNSDEDKTGLIPFKAIKLSEYHKEFTGKCIKITDENAEIYHKGIWIKYPLLKDEYPNYKKVMNDAYKDEPKCIFKIGFNVNLLKRLADAMGCESIIMHLNPAYSDGESGYSKPIIVKPVQGENDMNQKALLMPVKC